MLTSGTTNIAMRLRQARTIADLTLDEVSARLTANGHPLTKAALSKYETGKSTPRQSTLLALARILGVRSDFFVRGPTVQIEWRAFRKHANLSKHLQEQIQASIAQLVEGHVWLEESLQPGQKPRFPRPYRADTLDDAEAAAESVRKYWKLNETPIESMTQMIEDHGGVAVCSMDAPPDFDGLSGWANGAFPVLVSSARPSIDRRRYNFAHELGHLAMNCTGLSEKEEERLAHRFAAAFLVPASVAKRELGETRQNISMEELMLLKQKYGLSMQAWVHRARDLSIIGDAAYKRLWDQFDANGWREQEPVAFIGSEEPVRLKLLTLRALAEGVITPIRAEELCAGCTGDAARVDSTIPRLSVRELRKQPLEKREEALRQSTVAVEEDYRNDADLTAFEAFGEHDFHVNS